MKNLAELKQVLEYVPMVFTSFKLPVGEQALDYMLNVWWKFLAPYDLPIIITAIDIHASQCAFANIAQIADIAKDLQNKQDGNFKDSYTYFAEIENAVSYANAKENYAKLSEFSKQIVGGSYKLAQWATDPQGFNSTISNRLLKTIENTIKQDELKQKLERNERLLEITKKRKEIKQ